MGGAISNFNSSVVIKCNTITNNSALGHGGAIYCTGDYPYKITHNIISNNSGHFGGGIYCLFCTSDLQEIII